MKILIISDEESRSVWDYYRPGMLKDIDLILSAGDLSSDYLSFLVTFSQAPLLYVHGNHDESYDRKPPEGCTCIDDKIYIHEGIRILGLGGCARYSDGRYQFTEKEMRNRVLHLMFPLLYHKGFDILLTHAPVKGFHDGEDPAHRGFQIFDTLIRKYRPAYHIHGHIHQSYGREFCRMDRLYDTTVINAFGKYVIENAFER